MVPMGITLLPRAAPSLPGVAAMAPRAFSGLPRTAAPPRARGCLSHCAWRCGRGRAVPPRLCSAQQVGTRPVSCVETEEGTSFVGAVMLVAVLALGSSAVLARAKPLARTPALVVAAWRMGLASGVFAAARTLGFTKDPAAASPSEAPAGNSTLDKVFTTAAGVFIGAHFICFYTALQLTTVLRATLLCTLAPVFAGLFSFIGLPGSPASQPPKRFWAGIAIALAGVRLTLPGESSPMGAASSALAGDVVALLGAALLAAYLRLGSVVRKRVPLHIYQFQVTRVAAMMLFPIAWVCYGNVFVAKDAWFWLLLGTLTPQLVGQNGLDYAVARVPARTVAAACLLEPVAAAFLAWACLGEAVSAPAAAGCGLVLVGLMLAVSKRTT